MTVPSRSPVDDSAQDLLQVRGLTKRFMGLVAVNNVSLSIPRGQIRGLIGPNGSGKTTFFNLVTGIYKPDGGEVLLEGGRITGYAPYKICRAGITRTFQNIRLFKEMTVLENVMLGSHHTTRRPFWQEALGLPQAGAEWREVRDRARELLQFIGLSGREQTIARNLAYGEQRLVEVARALAARPSLLILDEPTAGMTDPEGEALAVLIRRVREKGTTVLLVEHNMRFVMGLCDRISVLNSGEKIAEGTPAEVQNDESVIEAYLGKEEEDA